HLADPALSGPAGASRDQARAGGGAPRGLPQPEPDGVAGAAVLRARAPCRGSRTRGGRALPRRVDGAACGLRVRRHDQRRDQLRAVRRTRPVQGQRPGPRDPAAERLLPFRPGAQDPDRRARWPRVPAWRPRAHHRAQGQPGGAQDRLPPRRRARGEAAGAARPASQAEEAEVLIAADPGWVRTITTPDSASRIPSTSPPPRMSKQNQWIVGINAVASAVEHDAEHVREVLIEAGAKNPRLTEIESSARRREIDVRRGAPQALDGVA